MKKIPFLSFRLSGSLIWVVYMVVDTFKNIVLLSDYGVVILGFSAIWLDGTQWKYGQNLVLRAYFACSFLKNGRIGQMKIFMPKCTAYTNLKKPSVILANAAVLKIELFIFFLRESGFWPLDLAQKHKMTLNFSKRCVTNLLNKF